MSKINERYIFKDIKKSVYSLLDDTTTAEYYGFRNKKMIDKMFNTGLETNQINDLMGY